MMTMMMTRLNMMMFNKNNNYNTLVSSMMMMMIKKSMLSTSTTTTMKNNATLTLSSSTTTKTTNTCFHGTSFGAPISLPISGEVVFTTSLVGYPESMTDPSYHGQILVFTQPLIGNYGVPSTTARDEFGLLSHVESESIQVKGIIVSDVATRYSHWNAVESLASWCTRNKVAAISGVDTRAIVSLLRESGTTTLGEMTSSSSTEEEAHHDNKNNNTIGLDDPNTHNLVSRVSTKTIKVYNPIIHQKNKNMNPPLKIALIDCGVKHNIIRALLKRGAQVTVLPWNFPIQDHISQGQYDGVFISNGPGDPKKVTSTISNLSALLTLSSQLPVPIPIFGICMGHQLLGLAAGYTSYKLPYGNRGHNQPCMNTLTGSCVITSQNHGYALFDKDPRQVPEGWTTYFVNANDGSNEGIRHASFPFSSVQFHPEAKGGPLDTDDLFDTYVRTVESYRSVRLQQQQQPKSSKSVFFGSRKGRMVPGGVGRLVFPLSWNGSFLNGSSVSGRSHPH